MDLQGATAWVDLAFKVLSCVAILTMYAVRAEMDLGDDQEVDDTAVVRVD